MFKGITTSTFGTRIVEKIREWGRARREIRELITNRVPGGVTWALAKTSSRPVRTMLFTRVAPGQVYAEDIVLMRRAQMRRQG